MDIAVTLRTEISFEDLEDINDARDIIVDGCRMMASSNGKVVAAIKSGKIKTAALMVGTVLVFFNNFPFSHFFSGIRVAEYLLYFATLMSLISMIQYYVLNKNIIADTK